MVAGAVSVGGRTKVRVALVGCDDSTYIDLWVTDDERSFLERLEVTSKKESTYRCMPTLEVRAA